MRIQGEAKLLRIFVSEKDQWESAPLYEAIVLKARELGLAGATVVRGIQGFGAQSRIQTQDRMRLSENLPVVIEIADTADRIKQFLPEVDRMVDEGLVTMEDVRILVYRHSESGPR